MPKTALEQWDETAANNTDVGGVDIDEGCAPSGMNNAHREEMAQFAKWLGDDTLASASTTDLGSVPGRYVSITGTTTITAFGTIKAGTVKYVKFAGALTLTHNATSLILPSGSNIVTAAGDTAIFVSEGSGNWRCLAYQLASGSPISVDRKTIVLKQGTNPTPTAEGDIQWDTDDNAIQVGDGSSTKIFRPGTWELITTATPSGAATEPFTDLSAYRVLRATYYLTPSVDNETLYLQVSTNNGSGYDSSNYAGQRLESFSTTTATATTTGTGFVIGRGVGNATPEAASGVITINEFNQAKQAYATAQVTFLDGSLVTVIGTFAGRSTITTARDAIRFLAGSGNISGRIVLEGIRG